MKIAVSSENLSVSEHFGHCTNFNIYVAESGGIVAAQSVPNPGHRPGYLPNFLADQGVGVVISGGMGDGAAEIFAERGVEVVTGASGSAKEAAQSYLGGTLQSAPGRSAAGRFAAGRLIGSVCHEHSHADRCGQ